MSFSFPTGLKPAVDFCLQVLVGAILFAIVASAALALAFLVSWIETWEVAPTWLVSGLHWVEWAIFWADVFSFGLFLIAEVLKLARGLWRDWKSG